MDAIKAGGVRAWLRRLGVKLQCALIGKRTKKVTVADFLAELLEDIDARRRSAECEYIDEEVMQIVKVLLIDWFKIQEGKYKSREWLTYEFADEVANVYDILAQMSQPDNFYFNKDAVR